jgi:N-acetylglutamate synthase-like GNAT family acetyltransferase/ribosomal protein S17E
METSTTETHQEINKPLINEIIERVQSAVSSSDESEGEVDLGSIFERLYPELDNLDDNSDGYECITTSAPYAYRDSRFWGTEKDVSILTRTINVLMRYEQILGTDTIKKLVTDIADKWESYTWFTEDSHHFSNEQSMKQIIFFALLKCARDGGNIDLDSFELVKYESIDGESIGALDEKEMGEIYFANYCRDLELRDILIQKFHDKVRSGAGQFIVMRFEGHIVGFYELDKIAGDKIHFSMFNVYPGLDGSGIGKFLLDKRLNKDAEHNVILAECDLITTATQSYLKNGFIGYKVDYMAGIDALSIVRNDTLYDKFKSTNLSESQFFEQLPGMKFSEPDLNDTQWCEYAGKDIVVVKIRGYDDKTSSHDVAHELDDYFTGKHDDRKYVLSKIFHKHLKNEVIGYDTYCVLESIQDKDLDSLLSTFKDDPDKKLTV